MSTVAPDLAALPSPAGPSLDGFSQPAYHPHDYHRVQDAIRSLVQEIKEMVPAMTIPQRAMIANLIGATLEDGPMPTELTMSEVSKQYQIVLKLQDQLINDVGGIMSDASAKEISALITAMNNTIALFMRSQKDMNHLEEMQNMREAIVYALKESPAEVQENFFKRIDEHRALKLPRVGA